MGRKTYESIGRSLPNRRIIVLTRNPGFRAPEVEVAHDLDEAFALAAEDDDVFVAGGSEIYRAALPHADRIYLTVIHADVYGDVFFPEFDTAEWQLVQDERHEADEQHRFPFSFRVYVRQITIA